MNSLKEEILSKLEENKNKLDTRTYNGYKKNITIKKRKDTINKLNNELDILINQYDKNNIIPVVKNKEDKVKKIKVNKNDLKPSKITLKKSGITDQFGAFIRKNYQFEDINNINDYIEAIKIAKKDIKAPSHITMYFKSLNSKGLIQRTIPFDRLDLTEQGFEDFYNDLTNRDNDKNVYGSDSQYNPEVNALILSSFELSKINPVGQGKSDKIIFETENIESKEGLCAYECLKKCNIEYNDDKIIISNLFNLIEYIKNENLPISIIANSFNLNKDIDEIQEIEKTELIEVEDKKKKIKKRCIHMNNFFNKEYISVIYLHKADYEKYAIVYDETNKHFDVCCNNKITLKNDLYLSLSNNIIHKNKIIGTQYSTNKNAFYKPKIHSRYIFFDYETVIDFEKDSCMREYSLSILALNNEHLNDLTKYDENNDKEKVNEIRTKYCKTFLGYDCSKQFIEWLKENQINTEFTFIGFNNSNFDNFILLNALLENDIKVSDIFFNNNQLLNFKISGRHDFFDIRKHLMGSLKKNCEDFKIKCCSKLDFDHHKAQTLYDNNQLIEFITNNEELKTYNEFDVLATAVLFNKYKKALYDIPATKDFSENLTEIKTIGSLIYNVFTKHKENNNIQLPKLSYQYYDDLQKSKIAGRVQLFNGVQKVNERLVSTDVCSLYPYVMSVLNCYYPTGKIQDVDEYQGDDVIGFYYCDFNQSNLRKMNLPNIYANKTGIENNWDYDGEIKNYLLSNVMIGLMKKYNVDIKIKNGFIFTEKKKSCEMFKFLLDFMSAKNQQDTLKKNKDIQYNSALRETLKLLMNSLSGKVIEGLHTEKTVAIETLEQYIKIKDKALSTNIINIIGEKMFITYEVNPEDICDRQQRPIYLGVLIYDYAKRYMYENSYSKVGLNELLYTDTDASKFRYKRFIEWKKWIDNNNIQVPHWKEVEDIDERYKDHKIYESNSKVFGSFEDELEDMVGNDYVFYCLEKKSWLYGVDGESKYRFKGINGNAQLLTLNEDFIEKKIINHKDGTTEEKYNIKENMDKEIYYFYNNNKKNEIDNNSIGFFDKLYNEKEAYVLVNSFRKIVKNNKRNVGLEDIDKHNDLMNSIQVNFMIKKLSLKI